MSNKRACNLYFDDETIEKLEWLSGRLDESKSGFLTGIINWEAFQKGFHNRNKSEKEFNRATTTNDKPD